jgi:steroid delta-isomerase-like uncharacterized protein
MRRIFLALPIFLITVGLVYIACDSSSQTQLEKNKNIIRRMMWEMDKQNWTIIRELYAPNFTYHQPGNPKLLSRDEFEKTMRMIYAAFPDGSQTIEDIVAECDKVVTRLTLRGTHRDDFMDIAATGKEVIQSNIIIFRITDGKITEAWEECDMLNVMQQLGAIPF